MAWCSVKAQGNYVYINLYHRARHDKGQNSNTPVMNKTMVNQCAGSHATDVERMQTEFNSSNKLKQKYPS